MTKKRLDERRKRNQELAAMDAANRCQRCKVPLRKADGVMEWGSGRRFCTRECLTEDAVDQTRGL